MLRGIYSSATGMINEMNKVSMHAGNIANAQTLGFKRREMTSVPFKELLVNVISEKGGFFSGGGEIELGNNRYHSVKAPIGTGSGFSYMNIIQEQGVLQPTSNGLDLGIVNKGWFVIGRRVKDADPNGDGSLDNTDTYTTKNGRFMLDRLGYIVNPDGDFLLDDGNQSIRIDLAGKHANDIAALVTIKEDGTILNQGSEVAKIQIHRNVKDSLFIQPELKLAMPATEVADDMLDDDGKRIMIKQGFVELSNVSIIEEMIGLIHSSKTYESGHKLIMSADKILDKSINEMGRTG